MVERLIGHWGFEGNLTATVGLDAVLADPDPANAIPSEISFVTGEDAAIGNGAVVVGNVADASETLLDIPGSADLYNFYPSGLTISIWVKTPEGANGYQDIVSKKFDEGATRVFLRLAGTNALFRMGNPGVFTGASINDGGWKFLVVTYDATVGEATMYLNGTARGTVAMAPTSAGNIANLAIGDGFNGTIDDVKIYTYPISSDTIAQDYIAATGKPLCVNPNFVGAAFDFNGDCAVNTLDLAKFAEAWLANGFYEAPLN